MWQMIIQTPQLHHYSSVCRGSKHKFVSEDIFWGSGSSPIPQTTVRSHRVTLYNSSLLLRNFSKNLLLTIRNFHLHLVDSSNFCRVKTSEDRFARPQAASSPLSVLINEVQFYNFSLTRSTQLWHLYSTVQCHDSSSINISDMRFYKKLGTNICDSLNPVKLRIL